VCANIGVQELTDPVALLRWRRWPRREWLYLSLS